MLKINLVPKCDVVTLPRESGFFARPQPLKVSSAFIATDTSAQHLIHQPKLTRTTQPFIARSMPFAFSLAEFMDKRWILSTILYFAIVLPVIYVFARWLESSGWPSITSLPDEESPGTKANDDFIGPRFAPGSRDIDE